MQENDLKIQEKISAILFLYNDSISISKIKEFLNNDDIKDEELIKNLENLNDYLNKIGLTLIKKENKNFDKIELTIAVKKELSEIAKMIKKDELEGELTPAALQVMTICAYLDSPTKNEISFIRGVQSSQSIRSLSARGLLKREGERYSLSIDAIKSLGISSLQDLPEYEKIKKDFEERLKDILKEE
ncbi:MAG: SMC-Scp complex subunit ScpB [Candidatus Paceibacterota bacterium]|jgi:segregation and condensation protein B